MNKAKTILAGMGTSLARAELSEQGWQVTYPLEEIKINSIVQDPSNPQRIYMATQHQGVLKSLDTGKTWQKKV